MKFELKDVQDILQSIQQRLGFWGIIILVTLIIIAFIMTVYLKYSFKAAAEESSKKTIEDFKNHLSKSLQTQMGLFFRDENIRNSLLVSVGQKSFEKKIELWQLSQNSYFSYQKSWSFSQSTDIKEYVELDNTFNDLRLKIFNETIYLGYHLSQKLIRLNSLMREGLRKKKTELSYSGKNYNPHNEDHLKHVLQSQTSIETNISDLLAEIEDWVIKNLHSDQTIEKFEFTGEQLEKIKTERIKHFDTFTI